MLYFSIKYESKTSLQALEILNYSVTANIKNILKTFGIIPKILERDDI